MNRQFPTLVRHFFGRFFDNELVSPGMEMHATVVKILAVIAVPGIMMPFFRYPKYSEMYHLLARGRIAPETIEYVRWGDESMFVAFAMLVMGVATVIEWDSLFPDRRDYASLVPLPIRARTIFFAKIVSLILFLLGFTAAVNLIAAVTFPLLSGGSPTIASLLGKFAGHFAAVFGASAFVFLSLVALQGILLEVLSPRLFRRVSVYVQLIGVAGLLWMFLFFPQVAAWKWNNTAILWWYPPAWFAGIYEVLRGAADDTWQGLARRGSIATATVTLLAASAYTIGYRRHVRRTLESLEGSGVRSRIDDWLSRAADRIAPSPIERAAFAFTIKTLVRSPRHRVMMAGYLGVGFAIAATVLGISRSSSVFLQVALAVIFFAITGLRFVFTIPAELAANWVFRLAEHGGSRLALAGVRKASIVTGVAPVLLLAAPLYFAAWDWWIAVLCLIYTALVGALLSEALLAFFQKIPFTCTYPPGKANITVLWVVYLAALAAFAFGGGALGLWLAARPLRFLSFTAVAAGLWFLLQHPSLREDPQLLYDDAPDPTVRTLGLAEFTKAR